MGLIKLNRTPKVRQKTFGVRFSLLFLKIL